MALRSAKKSLLSKACCKIELQDSIGNGGNAVVYRGLDNKKTEVAVKFFLNENTKRYSRFKDEVIVVTTRLLDSKYVIPILDYELPSLSEGCEFYPWYSMPIAEKMFSNLAGKSWAYKVNAIADLADGLAAIHSLKVAHRDIKPENLFLLGDTYRFGDFGIASFPENSGVTGSNEPMGPWAFMAPEMLSAPDDANAFKADVYSFAKTIWCFLTERKIPFIGSYDPDSSDGLAVYLEKGKERFVVEPLDSLLKLSTCIEVDTRPSAQEFAKALRYAAFIQENFDEANKLQWEAAEVASLRVQGLLSAVWSGVAEIAEVLTLMGRRDGLNHCFFPDGGGQTLEGAYPCEAGEMLALKISSGSIVVVKPTRLTLERFPKKPDFGYLVLETKDVEPLGVNLKYRSNESELLKKLNDYDYVVNDFEEYEPINSSVGIYCKRRFKGGDFIIAPSAGIFNRIDDYSGTENKSKKIRMAFEKLIDRLEAEKEEAEKKDFILIRKVRLLTNHIDSRCEFTLNFLSMETLVCLIDLDEACQKKRQESRGGNGTDFGVPTFEQILRSVKTELEIRVLKLLNEMSLEQRAELLALIDIGRGRIHSSEMDEQTRDGVSACKYLELDYFLGKFGNGYLKKALRRFGLHVQLNLSAS